MNREETMLSTNGHQDPVTNGNGAAPHGDRADKVLTIVSQFLELQTAQQRMLDRLLTMHDHAAQHAPAMGVNGLAAVTYVEPVRPAAYVTAAPATPAARPEPTVAAVARVKKAPPRPAPPAQRLTPKPVEAPAVERRVSAPAPAPTPTSIAKVAPAPAPIKAQVAAPAPAVAPSGDVPSSEVFRQDLLQAVAERTGYPVDALDETLQLESGLGIDSIKTIEIFSKLKSYHSVFRVEGEDEEELMGEFSRLKTLGDIVQFYEDRRSKKLASGGSAASGSDVERHVLTATDASADSSKKKPSH
jgi:acyl carrier protein